MERRKTVVSALASNGFGEPNPIGKQGKWNSTSGSAACRETLPNPLSHLKIELGVKPAKPSAVMLKNHSVKYSVDHICSHILCTRACRSSISSDLNMGCALNERLCANGEFKKVGFFS
jgi:hypothetical protein